MKLGRNQPCWCNSGIKYKKCHYDRESQKPVSEAEIYQASNKFYSSKSCSVPEAMKHECNKKIIKAHSVSKGSSLKAISVDGHVLTTLNLNAGSYKNFKPVLIGINKASTFTGFCGKHDANLFSPIENSDFNGSAHHCFLLAYRALTREKFVKNAVIPKFDLMKKLDKGKDLDAQLNIQAAQQYYEGNNNLTISDLGYLKGVLDDQLINKQYDTLNHVIFELENTPQVMGSSVGGIMIGFNGEPLQVTSNDPNDIPDYTFVNSFSSGGKGYIVLSWIPEHDTTNLIITNQLVDSDNTPDSLVMLMFSYIENLYMSPDWWKSLDDKTKRKLVDTFLQGATKDTTSDVLSVIPDLKMPKLKSFKTVNYNESCQRS